jgi:hypothetical protein
MMQKRGGGKKAVAPLSVVGGGEEEGREGGMEEGEREFPNKTLLALGIVLPTLLGE